MSKNKFEEQITDKHELEKKENGEWCDFERSGGIGYHVFEDGRKMCLKCHKLKDEKNVEKCDRIL